MTKLIAVHGFMYDPENVGGINDPKKFFDDMRDVTGRDVHKFSYYSVPFGFKLNNLLYTTYQTTRAWLGSWFRGYLHPYRYAWSQAEQAGWELAKQILDSDEPVDIICHSLGSRVVAQAIHYAGYKNINRVVILNGAELVRNVKGMQSDKILNVCVRTDDVLGLLGSRFSGDKNGPTVGQFGVPGWVNVFLDDPKTIKTLKDRYNWTVQGDNPESMFDHWYSYRFEGNHDLIKAWFDGVDVDLS